MKLGISIKIPSETQLSGKFMRRMVFKREKAKKMPNSTTETLGKTKTGKQSLDVSNTWP